AVAAPGTGLFVLSGVDGRELWHYKLDSNPMSTTLALDLNGDGTRDVIVGTSSGRLLARDGRTGRAVWSVFLGSQPAIKVAIADVDADGVGDIWVNPLGSEAVAISGRDGRVLDHFTPQASS